MIAVLALVRSLAGQLAGFHDLLPFLFCRGSADDIENPVDCLSQPERQ